MRDVKYQSLRETPPRIVYLPDLQVPGPVGEASIAVRTAANPEKMADLLRKEGMGGVNICASEARLRRPA